jgi:putative ABC transport system substrate-binding protein
MRRDRTKRRDLLLGLLALPLPAHAQGRPLRIGLLTTSEPPPKAVAALRDSLGRAGYGKGADLVIDTQWPSASAPLPVLAEKMVHDAPDVMVVWATPAALAAKAATATIPIVVVGIADPVGVGLVASLAHPGGNITGFSNLGGDLSAKQVEVFAQAVPNARRLGVIYSPASPAGVIQFQGVQGALQKLGIPSLVEKATQPPEYREALAHLAQAAVDGVLFVPDATTVENRADIAAQAQALRLPTMFQRRENVEAGGLMSYGPDLSDQFRQVAFYVDRILKGAKPADLPVQQPNKIELVINARTAKAIGASLPQALLARADEVIE